MNIIISANDKFVYPAKVMLTSLFLNNPDADISIYFLHSSVTPENVSLLEQHAKKYSGKFTAIQINADNFDGFFTTWQFPVEVYYRFLIPGLLPESEERALWLDVDLIVNKSLTDFYYQDFDSNCFVACEDSGREPERYVLLGCQPDIQYVNSGVLLFNLPLVRQYTLEHYRNYYLAHSDAIRWPDQDIINAMFEGKIKIADRNIYNRQMRFDNYMSKAEKEAILQNAVILHYVGILKPWQRGNANPVSQAWDHYYTLTNEKGKLYNAIYIFTKNSQRFLQKHLWRHMRTLRGFLYQRCTPLRNLKDSVKKILKKN